MIEARGRGGEGDPEPSRTSGLGDPLRTKFIESIAYNAGH